MTLLVFAVVAYLAVTVKANCKEKADAGNCAFYVDCVEARFQCGDNGYPLAYGERYCRHFTYKQIGLPTAVSF